MKARVIVDAGLLKVRFAEVKVKQIGKGFHEIVSYVLELHTRPKQNISRHATVTSLEIRVVIGSPSMPQRRFLRQLKPRTCELTSKISPCETGFLFSLSLSNTRYTFKRNRFTCPYWDEWKGAWVGRAVLKADTCDVINQPVRVIRSRPKVGLQARVRLLEKAADTVCGSGFLLDPFHHGTHRQHLIWRIFPVPISSLVRRYKNPDCNIGTSAVTKLRSPKSAWAPSSLWNLSYLTRIPSWITSWSIESKK